LRASCFVSASSGGGKTGRPPPSCCFFTPFTSTPTPLPPPSFSNSSPPTQTHTLFLSSPERLVSALPSSLKGLHRTRTGRAIETRRRKDQKRALVVEGRRTHQTSSILDVKEIEELMSLGEKLEHSRVSMLSRTLVLGSSMGD